MPEKAGRCPICKKPADAKFRPFCSQRCSRIDLGKWLGEGYRVQSDLTDEDEANLPSSSGAEEEE